MTDASAGKSITSELEKMSPADQRQTYTAMKDLQNKLPEQFGNIQLIDVNDDGLLDDVKVDVKAGATTRRVDVYDNKTSEQHLKTMMENPALLLDRAASGKSISEFFQLLDLKGGEEEKRLFTDELVRLQKAHPEKYGNIEIKTDGERLTDMKVRLPGKTVDVYDNPSERYDNKLKLEQSAIKLLKEGKSPGDLAGLSPDEKQQMQNAMRDVQAMLKYPSLMLDRALNGTPISQYYELLKDDAARKQFTQELIKAKDANPRKYGDIQISTEGGLLKDMKVKLPGRGTADVFDPPAGQVEPGPAVRSVEPPRAALPRLGEVTKVEPPRVEPPKSAETGIATRLAQSALREKDANEIVTALGAAKSPAEVNRVMQELSRLPQTYSGIAAEAFKSPQEMVKSLNDALQKQQLDTRYRFSADADGKITLSSLDVKVQENKLASLDYKQPSGKSAGAGFINQVAESFVAEMGAARNQQEVQKLFQKTLDAMQQKNAAPKEIEQWMNSNLKKANSDLRVVVEPDGKLSLTRFEKKDQSPPKTVATVPFKA